MVVRPHRLGPEPHHRPAYAALSLLTLLLLMLAGLPALPALAEPPQAAPTITAVSPATVSNGVNTPIVIEGAGFAAAGDGSAPAVTLAGRTLADVVLVSATQLSATVPWGLAPGTYDITVTNGDGQPATLPAGLTVTEALGVWITGGPYGGQVYDLVAADAGLYAVVHNTGIFLRPAGQTDWDLKLVESWPMRMAIDAADPSVLYASAHNALSRSLDGGATWAPITPAAGPMLPYIYYPFAHPTDTGVVYAAVSATVSRPVEPGEQGGLYRSTDRGANWTPAVTGLGDTHVTALAFYPGAAQQMLAGTRSGDIYYSVDGGSTWTLQANIGKRVERLYFDPFSAAHEAYAVTAHPYVPNQYPYLYRSAGDLGDWQPVALTSQPPAPGADVVWSLAFAAGRVYAAAGSGYASDDAGLTWTPLSPSLDDVTAFALPAAEPGVIYAGTRSRGAWRTEGGAWQEHNQGLAGVLPYALAVSPTDPQEIYALSEAMGLLKSNNAGHSWRALGAVAGGPPWQGMPLAVDPHRPDHVYLGTFCHGADCLLLSDDAGDTWQPASLEVPAAMTAGGAGAKVYAVAASPTTPGRVLAGLSSLPSDYSYVTRPLGAIYSSDDYGTTWTLRRSGPDLSGILSLAFDPATPGLVYAGTDSTGLWRSRDGGDTWERVAGVPGAKAPSLATAPGQPGAVYACLGAADNSSVALYLSRDEGATWQELLSGATQVLFTASSPAQGYALVGGELRRSTDGGLTWQAVPDVPAGNIWTAAAGSDGERVLLYVSASGGMVGSNGGPAAQAAAEAVAGGVYARASRAFGPVYLPLAVRTGH